MLMLLSSYRFLVILFSIVIRAIGIVSSKGRIVNQENSGTVGVGVGVAEGVVYGE